MSSLLYMCNGDIKFRPVPLATMLAAMIKINEDVSYLYMSVNENTSPTLLGFYHICGIKVGESNKTAFVIV